MPYRTKGKTVQKKVGGKWKKKAKCKSKASCKKQVKLLRAVKHGWKPTKNRRK
jgi:hypothetical protein